MHVRCPARSAITAVVALLATVAVAVGPAPGPSPAGAADRFPDVIDTNPFHDDIDWLVDHGATGYEDGTYRPTLPITRQALVQLLWKLSGSPAGPFPAHGFSDVPAEHPFATAIAWAADEVLVTGFDDGTFRPGVHVSRQAVTAVLFRMGGLFHNTYPSPPFGDVGATHRFRHPIAFAAATNLADGYPDNTYRPTAPISRQALAALLHRFHSMFDGVWPAPPHHHECTDPVTPEQQAAADQLVVDVKASLERWPTLSDAYAAGYQQIAPPFGGAGAHYLNVEYANDGIILDPMKPESLMYDGNELQGAMFLMESVADEGPMVGGCLTPWHSHNNLCYAAPPNEGGYVSGFTEMGCFGSSQLYITPGMLHVWVIDRPGGPFEDIDTSF